MTKKIAKLMLNGQEYEIREYQQPGWQPGANTLLYYPLIANANDATSNHRDGISYNATFSINDGAFLIGTQSAGNNGRIESPSFTVGTVYTLNTRVKLPTALSGDHYLNLQTNWSYDNRYIQAILNSSGISVLLGNGGGANGSVMNWSTSLGTTRHNIVMVRDENKVTMYLDGTSLGQQTTTYSVSTPQFRFGNDAPIGANYGASSYFKDYIIEDVQWTAQEVLDYYNATKDNYPSSTPEPEPEPQTEPCTVCGGTGEEECIMCSGTGQEMCPTCSGTGQIGDPEDPESRTECPDCNGGGFMSCGICDGTGMVTCSNCGGTGEEPGE